MSSAWKSNLDIAIKNGSFGSVIKRTTCILKQRKKMPSTVVKNVIGLLIIFMLVYQNKNAQIKKDDQ